MVAENGHLEESGRPEPAVAPASPAPAAPAHDPSVHGLAAGESPWRPQSSVPPSPADAAAPPHDSLSPADAALLLTLVDTPGTVADAATSRGMTADRFLALIANPAARRALDDVRAFAAARRELRADADREELTAVLKLVAAESPNLVEKRRAATAALRTIDNSLRRATGYAPRRSSDPERAPRRVARAEGPESPDASTADRNEPPQRFAVADPYKRPWREVRLPRPARSPWEDAGVSGSAPSSPSGAGGSPERSAREPEGAPPSTASTPPHDHDSAAYHNGGFQGGEAPLDSDPGIASSARRSRNADITRSRAHPPAPASLPSPAHTPAIAADLQLAALRANDTPEPDTGIATIHAFFPPEVGDYFLFAERYADSLKSSLRAGDVYTLQVVHDDGRRAVVRASIVGGAPSITAPPRTVLAMVIHLARVETPAGPCWLNSAIHFCDSS